MKAWNLVFASMVLSVIIMTSCTKLPITSSSKKVEKEISSLIKKMTLEEKVEQITGIKETGFDTRDNERLGIPGFRMADGPVGVRWGKSTALPSGISLAATWDTVMAQKYAELLAKETRAKGRNFLLGPAVNIHRLPTAGRNFETYGEDPYLASRIAVNYIKALQGNNVIASVKHYALNNQEWQRTEVDVKIDERAMREIYLPAFEAAVKEADVYTVMSSYNKVNGWWMSENNKMLNDILKEEWGFDGLVISDWVSTHNTVYATRHGLDLEMPHDIVFTLDKIKEAIDSGQISEDLIDEKVKRILRVKYKGGLFNDTTFADTLVIDSQEHKDLALEIALNSIVLLKNENNILPLKTTEIKSIAVIGPNSVIPPTGGGGSSHVIPSYIISPLDALRAELASTDIIHSPGSVIPVTPLKPIPYEFLRTPGGSGGLKVEFFNNKDLSGEIAYTGLSRVVDFQWNDEAPVPNVGKDNYSARWTGLITIPESREYTFYTASDDGVRLYINGELIINNWSDHGTTLDSAKVILQAGHSYPVILEYYENGGSEIIQLGWDYSHLLSENRLLTDAVAAAERADAAILYVGSTEYTESEGYDRVGGLNLIAGQNELINAVTRVNPNTIVVLYGGTPVIIEPWINNVKALVQVFFPGQEGGTAIARLLSGKDNFSGKLPFSFIASQSQSPAYEGYKDPSLDAPYKEGIYVGYRYLDKQNLVPTYPFGFGLSYTEFDYSDLDVTKDKDLNYTVKLNVKNTGRVKGKEVIQLYISPLNPITDRPIKELKGFTKIELEPGEEKSIALKLNKRSFSRYDTNLQDWVVDKGEYQILVGSSSDDIKSRTTINL